MARLVFEEEVPVDGDFGAALRTPAKAEGALARLTATSLRLAAVDVPHTERDGSGGLDDNLVLVPWARAEVNGAIVGVLLAVERAAI